MGCRGRLPRLWSKAVAMDPLIDLLNRYRQANTLEERQQLAWAIVAHVVATVEKVVYRSAPPLAAKDLLHDALVAIVKGLSGFRGASERELFGWCTAIARRKVVDHFRKSARAEMVPLDSASAELWLVADAEDGGVSAEDLIQMQATLGTLQALDPKCYSLLWLRYVEQWSHESIGQSEGLNADAARMKIKRCIEKARAALGHRRT